VQLIKCIYIWPSLNEPLRTLPSLRLKFL